MPLSRNRPQKLFSSSLSMPCFPPSELQALLVSHLSWILWRSPFSDSLRIAVDISIDKGDSLGKPCMLHSKHVVIVIQPPILVLWMMNLVYVMLIFVIYILTKPHPILVNSWPTIPNSHLVARKSSIYARSSIIAATPPLAGPSFKAFSYSDGEFRGTSLDLCMFSSSVR